MISKVFLGVTAMTFAACGGRVAGTGPTGPAQIDASVEAPIAMAGPAPSSVPAPYAQEAEAPEMLEAQAPEAFEAQAPETLVDAQAPSTLDGPATVVDETSTAASFQSCDGGGPGLSDCGPNRESCCVSLAVPGGDFFRSYDGVSCPGGVQPMQAPELGCYTMMSAPATVSAFSLDKYSVTIGRFRRFVAAVIGGWLPAAGSGKHEHLNMGKGLADSSAPGSFETGWDPTWNADLPGSIDDWLNVVSAGLFTATPNGNEEWPMSGMAWTHAYAFCIWDGGFLPSEAEWNFAAAGGSEQRVYPWSVPPMSQALDCSYATYQVGFSYCFDSSFGLAPVGMVSPKGDGRWGHADLTGNVSHWTLDWLAEYVTPCADCAYLQTPLPGSFSTIDPTRSIRGGNYASDPSRLLVSYRGGDFPASGNSDGADGFRCARAP